VFFTIPASVQEEPVKNYGRACKINADGDRDALVLWHKFYGVSLIKIHL
jgi:hypothetical protein